MPVFLFIAFVFLNPPLPLYSSPQHLEIGIEIEMEMWKRGSGRMTMIFLSLLIATAATAGRREWEAPGEGGDWDEKAPFLLKKLGVVTKTEGGEITAFRDGSWNGDPNPLVISFVTMEPNTLLVPHYMDADLILFLRTGEARIGWIHQDDLVERQLKPGDVLHIPAGSTFFFVNTGEDQRLQIISSIKHVGADHEAFFIGGGQHPPTVFGGFDISTLTSAFNATPEELGVLTSVRYAGSIIFNTGKEASNLHQLTGVMKSEMERLKHSRRLAQDDDVKIEMEAKEEKRKGTGTWTSILSSIFFGEAATEKNEARGRVRDPVDAPDAYNIYDHDPDFQNDYGWSIEVNEHDYLPLKQSDVSVFLVNLSAGTMMAPHVNPRATEYGIVLAGKGTVEVVYPNGTKAMKAEVKEGDAFWVPRFYPFCQVAAREGPLEILGFTTSARSNRPQFLVGKSSILRAMMGQELAAGFGMREEELRQLVMKQNESVILPGWEDARGRE